MGTRGLTKEIIIANAVEYIKEMEQPTISLHEIARRLGIKTPSLYNHIKNTTELRYEVYQYAIYQFVQNQEAAIKGLYKDDAIRAFANAYHKFAMQNKGLYRLIMSIPSEDDDRAKEMAVPLLDTVVAILLEYNLSRESIAHWQRVFRAILHGFVSQEYLGYFYYYNNVDLDKSRDIAVKCFLNGLNCELKEKK